MSFDPHPRKVVRGEIVPLLTTIDERGDVLESLGIDRFVIMPFTRAFSQLSAEEFVDGVLIDQIGLREIVIGYDHAFGHDRRGDASLLEQMGAANGFTVDVIPPQIVEEHVVSSTEIRKLLGERGDVEAAAEMLGRSYSLRGTVVRGEGRGRTIGFPTANVEPAHPEKVLPSTGVFAVRVERMSDDGSGAMHPGMMNVGLRPTFGGSDRALEVHLLDFEGDLYGEDLRIEFVARMRDERRFDSKDKLVEQLSKDRMRCKQLLGEG